MKEFIYEKSNSLSNSVCEQLILHFENNKAKQTKSLNATYMITDVYELPIKIYSKDTFEKEIYANLLAEINTNTIEYYATIPFYQNQHICANDMVIQNFIKNSGTDECHNDLLTIGNKHRIFTYIWFLNDVLSGGEVCFFNQYNIVPEKGKLILFPADWFFSYTNKIALTDNKYIIIGHLYYDI